MTSDVGTEPRAEDTDNSLNRFTIDAGTSETLQVVVTSAKDDSRVVLATIVIEIGENVMREVETSSTRNVFHKAHPPNARSVLTTKSMKTLCFAD
jgi:hypothetical protein